LVDLKSVFDTWRRKRRHVREPTPKTLVERAIRAASVHGATAVREATGISARHSLASKARQGPAAKRVERLKGGVTSVVPAFSRIELSAPVATGRPLVEVESSAGIKLRIFTVTTETLSLVNALCGKGGEL
jgi:hypothetical protein